MVLREALDWNGALVEAYRTAARPAGMATACEPME
jgi:hypothetical protein